MISCTGGNLMIESSGNTVVTRVGCYEELRCTGVGTKISWRVFGIKVDLENSTTEMHYVSVSHCFHNT